MTSSNLLMPLAAQGEAALDSHPKETLAKRAAHAAAHALGHAAHAVDHAAHSAAHAVDHAAHSAAHAVDHAAQHVHVAASKVHPHMEHHKVDQSDSQPDDQVQQGQEATQEGANAKGTLGVGQRAHGTVRV